MAEPAIDALEAVSRRLRPAIRAYFTRRLNDRSEAEDMTQDVLVALARHGELRQVANIESYVFRIAANLLRDRARTRRRRPLVLGEPFDHAVAHLSDDLSPERIAAARSNCTRLAQVLLEMPERMRTIFILSRFEDMTGREIAMRLGVSVSAVEKNVMRALTMLRERME